MKVKDKVNEIVGIHADEINKFLEYNSLGGTLNIIEDAVLALGDDDIIEKFGELQELMAKKREERYNQELKEGDETTNNDKPKTLKDIEWKAQKVQEGKELKQRDIAPKEQLKKEAIGWIKKLSGQPNNMWARTFCFKHGFIGLSKDNCECDDDNILMNYEYESSDIDGAIKFIKHFFNLTEEDLEDETR